MRLGEFFQMLIDNWQVKVLSLLTALLLYLLAQNAGMVQREMHTEILIKTPPGIVLADPSPREAEIKLRGPREQIYAVRPGQIELAADFTHVEEPGVYRGRVNILDTHITDLIRPLEIDYQPRQIEVQLEYAEE